MTVIGPKILAHATNLLFNGLVGKALPAGVTKAQVIAALHHRGQNQFAQMLSGMDVKPGVGVDFNACPQCGKRLGLRQAVILPVLNSGPRLL